MAQDPKTVVKSSTQLGSTQVAIADAGEIAKPYDDAYKFAGGKRVFIQKKNYDPPNTEPADNPPDPLP
jgi:hypothetical protein